MDSILNTIKKLLGVDPNYDVFDSDLITYINSAFMYLNQLGVGPDQVFRIKDGETSWDEFLGNRIDFESAKTFIYLRTKLLFDPPPHSFLIDNIKDELKELEWRLLVQAKPIAPEISTDPDDEDY